MNLLTKLFGRPASSAASIECPSTLDDTEVEQLVRVYDGYGRELSITRDDWRDNVLLGSLTDAGSDPNRLYDLVFGALQDGFVAEVLPFAEQLRQLEPMSARSATLLGVIYLGLRRLDDAERLLTEQLREHGDDGYVLTNLAKVFAERGDAAQVDTLLWRALQTDPNQENAVAWFLSLANQRRGARGVQAALHDLAALPRSWRARLWMARAALEQDNVAEALRLYDEALELAPTPTPTDLLMQLSGDLGNHGQPVELLVRATPRFEAAEHGLVVGINLIKANVDLGRLDHARELVDRLYALERPDWQQALSFWEAEIATARASSPAATPAPVPTITMMKLTGPIWLGLSQSGAELCSPKDEQAVVVGFLGGTASQGDAGPPRLQRADAAGRITRALSLFLSEQFHLRSDGSGVVLQPFVQGSSGGLVLAGQPWSAEAAAEHARQCEPPADYVVVTHLDLTCKTPTLSLRLVRTIDGTVLESCEAHVDLQRPEGAFTLLAERTLASLKQRAGIERCDAPAWYQVPTGELFADYQLRIEQLLAATACQLDGSRRDFLSGEREMVAGDLELCLREPVNAMTRLLLFALLGRLQAIHPQVVAEYRGKVERLQAEHPLPEPAQGACNAMWKAITS